MATKDYYLSDKQNFGEPLNDRFNNINLNHNYQSLHCENVFSEKAVSNSRKVQKNDFTDSLDLKAKRNSNSWNKSNKNLSSSYLNLYRRESEEQKEFKKSKNVKNSTLSLHIAAYENLVERDSHDSNGGAKEGLKNNSERKALAKTCANLKQNFIDPSSFIENPFEFPRQQEEDRDNHPEIMQFKASRRLLNPNEDSEGGNQRYNSDREGSYRPPSYRRNETWDQQGTTNTSTANMSYGQKGWPRPAGNNQMNPIFQVGQQFGNQLGNLQGMINVPNVANLNALVNTAAFSNMLAQQQPRPPMLQQVNQQQQQRSNSPQNKKKSFVGSITKFLEGYGFIDDEVFFQTTVVSGGVPHMGARCMVEAVFNSSMPFHWNATSVQIIPDNNPPTLHQNAQRTRMPQQSGNRWETSTNGDTSSRHNNDRSNNYRNTHDHRDRDVGHSRRSPVHIRRDNVHPVRRRSPPPRRSSPGKSPMRRPEKRERSPRSSPPRRYRDESRTREESGPPSRRPRVTPRYVCKSVRPLVSKNVTCSDLRQRYSRLYVPSDFITCEMSWLDSFALDAPFQLGLNPISFHPVHKDVDIPVGTYPPEDLESPGDEDNRFIVRTLLLSHAGIADIRKKVFGLLPDGSIDENADTVPFNKAIQFLTGIRGRNEVMAIGGAYSPSKDGENPLDLPTLIKTAVRTTRELTGVDLSTCPTWYKIAHLEYYRNERERVDNVILLMPDTSSMNNLMPTPEQYESIITTLKAQLAEKISAIESEEFISSVEKKRKEAAAAAKESTTTTNGENVISGDQTTVSVVPSSDSLSANGSTTSVAPTHTAESTSTTTTTTDAKPVPATTTKTNEKSNDVHMEDDDEDEPIEKLHWSTVLSTLRVAELREQLTIRGLDIKGVKNVLINRLQKALDEEKVAEENSKAAVAEVKSEPAAEEVKDEPMETSVEEEKKEPEVETNAPEAEGEQEITLDQLVEKQDDDDFTPEELEEIRREKEKWEVIQNERKQALIRHFVFPEQPTVFAYPNKSIKGGRFDCKVSSLMSLLDYRIEDNKEASFEVFIFAEVIREMLERSYAFNIYKTLQSINELDVEAQKRKDALIAAIAPPPAAETNAEATEDGKEEVKVIEAATTTDGDKEKEREKSERELLTAFKQLVGNFDLFTSFAYYDQNLCGYLNDKDCEDIILSIGLRISRGDVGRLLKKVVARDTFSYRLFTDRWVDKDTETKYAAGFRDDAPSIETLLNLHPKEANGNDDADDKKKAYTGTPDVTENGVVIYKGAALNIKQSLERHQEIKEECTKLTTQLQEQDFVLKSFKEQVDTLEKKRDRLQTDVAHYRKKANDAEKCLKTNEDDVVAFKQSLQDCKRLGDRICGIVERVMPSKEKTKEPSAKPEAPQSKGSDDATTKDASQKAANESESIETNVAANTTEEINGEVKDVEAEESEEGKAESMDAEAAAVTEETSA